MVSVGAQRGGSVVIVKLIDPVQFCFLVVPKLKIAGEFLRIEKRTENKNGNLKLE
jgi:hypothetical protein